STHKHYSDESLTSLFTGWNIDKHVLQNSQGLTYEGFRGRLESSSYCPKPESSIYVHLLSELEDLYNRHSRKGQIQIDYSTELYLLKAGAI
ncbi:MAG: hypothetical protein HN368_18540, partial [Spirochaetales bacterium]|nr:hypothetical protein [Spirochaetales bacterium]